MPDLSHFAAEEVTGIDALGLDPLVILLQSGTFLLIFLIIKKYALEKIVHALEERRLKIKESLKNVDSIEQERAEAAEEVELLLAKARTDADEIISKSQREADNIVSEAKAQAEQRAVEIIEASREQTRQHIEKAKAELSQEMLQLISVAVENILDEKLDAGKDRQLIQKIVQKEIG